MPEAVQREIERGRMAALFIGMLGPPVIWLSHFQINFSLVPWACGDGSSWLIHVVTVVALALTMASGFVGWQAQAGNGVPVSACFMGIGGAVLAAGFSLVIVAQGIATIIIGPCS